MKYFIGLFIILFGLILAVNTNRNIKKSKAVSNWPTTIGTIKKCELKTHHNDNTTSYSIDLLYTYTLGLQGDKDYKYLESKELHPSPHTMTYGKRSLYKKLKSAKSVKVYYNPDNPNESYLIPGHFTFHEAAFYAGILIIICGLFTIVQSNILSPVPMKAVSSLEILEVKTEEDNEEDEEELASIDNEEPEEETVGFGDFFLKS